MTHKSFDNDNNNEKLEFLGDRVLGLIIAKNLILKYPKDNEGILDKKFANLVNKKKCAYIAEKINLKKFMYLGENYKKKDQTYEKISGDLLKTKQKKIKAVNNALEKGKKVVLDSTCRDKITRKIFLDIAYVFNVPVRAIYISTNFEEIDLL